MAEEAIGPKRRQGRRVYAMVARVPGDGIEPFAAYEARVLPLLAEHGGTLERRLRSADARIELHLVSFPSDEAFVSYRDDAQRGEQRHLLERSGAVVELLELYEVEPLMDVRSRRCD